MFDPSDFAQARASGQIDSPLAQHQLGSNSRETLELVADQLQSMLNKALGPDHMYVLVLRTGSGEDLKCNLISNSPIERAYELRDIFAELATRQVQTAN